MRIVNCDRVVVGAILDNNLSDHYLFKNEPKVLVHFSVVEITEQQR